VDFCTISNSKITIIRPALEAFGSLFRVDFLNNKPPAGMVLSAAFWGSFHV
jgi:hypothetical protein